jgi:hypothetical protein
MIRQDMCVPRYQEIHGAVRCHTYGVNHTSRLPPHARIVFARRVESTVDTATSGVRLSLHSTIADRVHEL